MIKPNLSPIKKDKEESALDNFEEGSQKMFQESDADLQSKLNNLFKNDGIDSDDEGLVDQIFKEAGNQEEEEKEMDQHEEQNSNSEYDDNDFEEIQHDSQEDDIDLNLPSKNMPSSFVNSSSPPVNDDDEEDEIEDKSLNSHLSLDGIELVEIDKDEVLQQILSEIAN